MEVKKDLPDTIKQLNNFMTDQSKYQQQIQKNIETIEANAKATDAKLAQN